MRAPARLAVAAAASLGASLAFAQPLQLSEYMGVPSGGVTCAPNPPFTIIVQCSPYSFGVDRVGTFGGAQVRFNDAGPFSRAIGMHPPSSGVAQLRFDLDAIRIATGREPLRFKTRVGIDAPSGGNLGTIFNILHDDSLVASRTVQNVTSPSVEIETNTEAVRFLDLQDQPFGGFNGNHAAFAEPGLTLGPECPVPALVRNPDETRNICSSEGSTFTVKARYWGPFTYQWQRETSPGSFVDLADGGTSSWDGNVPGVGAVVAGSQTDTLHIAPDTANSLYLGPAHAIRYRCAVSNSCGEAVGAATTLAIRLCAFGGCPADFDGSGGTPDATDIGAFFESWLAGSECADVDCSGGTPDSTDINNFFTLWLAGGC